MNTTMNVGYIGLGNIGKPTAQHLLREAFTVYVYDVCAPAMEDMVAAGAVGCASIAELARACSHIGICVRDDAQVEDLLNGADGVFAHAQPGTLVAIHSTVIQANLLQWAQQAAAIGLNLIDAPITGGAHRAQAGTLCYMVGGTQEQFAAGAPVFETSAEKIIHAGPVGSGIALKLCNNFIQYTEFVAMVEATRLAEACGLSVEVLRDVGLSNGVVNEQMYMFASGRNAMCRTSTEAQMDPYFGGMGRLGRKDLECAISTAAQKGVMLPTAEYIRDRIVDVFLAKDPSRPPA